MHRNYKEYRPSPRIQRRRQGREMKVMAHSWCLPHLRQSLMKRHRQGGDEWLTEIEKDSIRVCAGYLMCNALLSAVTQKKKEKMHCIKCGYIHNNALSHNQQTVKSRRTWTTWMQHRFLQRASSGSARRKPSDDRYPQTPENFGKLIIFGTMVDQYCRTL